jgi:hypothetical protein
MTRSLDATDRGVAYAGPLRQLALADVGASADAAQ